MPSRINLGPADAIPDGGRRAFALPFGAVVVFRQGDRFHALKNACPHRDEPLHTGAFDQTTVTCPGHAWRIDVATGQTDHELRARTYAVEVKDGALMLYPDRPGPT
jgi:nitrite reductase (NADH) small subunit